MTLHLSPELQQRVEALARLAGRKPDSLTAEILDAGVRRYSQKLAELRSALDEGEPSGIAEDQTLEGLLAELDAEDEAR